MNFYEVLGVEPTATLDEIATAYRKLARQHHPDAGGDAEAFKAIALANEVLSDPEKRAEYDRTGEWGKRPLNLAEQTVADLVGKAMNEPNTFNNCYSNADLVKWMQNAIDRQRSSHQQGKRRAEELLKSQEGLFEKFAQLNEQTTNPDSRDFILNCMRGHIEATKGRIEQEQKEIDQGTEILTYLNGITGSDLHDTLSRAFQRNAPRPSTPNIGGWIG